MIDPLSESAFLLRLPGTAITGGAGKNESVRFYGKQPPYRVRIYASALRVRIYASALRFLTSLPPYDKLYNTSEYGFHRLNNNRKTRK